MNKFISTSFYGQLNNYDRYDISGFLVETASCKIQRNIWCGGNITLSGTIFMNGVDLKTQLATQINYVLISSMASYLSPYALTTTMNGNLAQYVLTAMLAGYLSPYVLTSSMAGNLAPYVLTSSMPGNLAPYVLTSSMVSYLTPYVLTTSMPSNLAPYVLTSSMASYLLPYSLSTSVSGNFNNYVLTSSLSGILNPYFLKSNLTSTLAPYVLTSSMASNLAPYVLTSSMASTLAPYVLTTTLSNFITVQHAWTALQTFKSNVNIFAGTSLQFGAASNINLVNYGLTVSDQKLSFLASLNSDVQAQLNSFTSLTNILNTLNIWLVSQTFNAPTTFNNIVYYDSTLTATSITAIGNILQFYGTGGISFNCGGTSNLNSTSSFTFNPNYLLSTSPIICSDTVSSGNSFLSPYLNTYNNYALSTSPLISNVQTANLTSLTPTVKTQSTTFTSGNLCSINYPNNCNESINITIPISSGVQTGTFAPSSIGTFTASNVLSNCNFLVYNGLTLVDTIAAVMVSGGILTSTFTGTCNALGGLTNWAYQQFMANFLLAYTPPLISSAFTYTINFQCTLTLSVVYTGTINTLTGYGYMKFNTTFNGNYNTAAGFSLGPVVTGAIGTNYTPMTILIKDDNNIVSQTGTTYINNLNTYGNTTLNNLIISSPPIMSYTTQPTFTTNQIGYQVACTITALVQLPPGGTFMVIGNSVAIPQPGYYTVFWQANVAFTGATGSSNGQNFGVILGTSTAPTAFNSNAPLTNNFVQLTASQSCSVGGNQTFTSTAYFYVPTAGTSYVYLGCQMFSTLVTIKSTAYSSLQVVRTC